MLMAHVEVPCYPHNIYMSTSLPALAQLAFRLLTVGQGVNVCVIQNCFPTSQCAYNHAGVLCGACQEHLSLSLGSSRCLSCHSHRPVVLVVILLAAIIAGILLVIALLALNMTVAVGLINNFIIIFYANIVAANSAVFFPSSEPSFNFYCVCSLA